MVREIVRHYPDANIFFALDHPGSFVGMTLLELRHAYRERRSFHWKYVPGCVFAGLGSRVRKLPRKRPYSWLNLQNFLFDTVEACANLTYDYLVLADSDAMFVGPGLMTLLDGSWDFSCYHAGEDFPHWCHGTTFRRYWDHYAALAQDLGLNPKPHDFGTMFGLFMLSRTAVETLRNVLPLLEAHPKYRWFVELNEADFPFYEAFLPQLLGDLGLRPRPVTPEIPGYRNRPHWTVPEHRPEWWFYHPVDRRPLRSLSSSSR